MMTNEDIRLYIEDQINVGVVGIINTERISAPSH
jgi:hypothetical protein